MAIQDKRLVLLDGYTMTALNTTGCPVSSQINFGAADLNIGAGTPVYLNILIGETAVGAASPTTKFKLYTNSASVATGSALIAAGELLMETSAINTNTLSAGEYIWRHTIPVNIDDGQWCGLVISQAGADVSSGIIDAWLGLEAETDFGLQPSVLSC